MTCEKALEAMKQGKKVYRKAWSDGIIIALDSENKIRLWLENRDNHYGDEAILDGEEILADDWEIYEEPQKEPEMTAEKAIETLESIRQVTSKSVIPDVDEAIDFAIEALENQNQPEKKCECKCNCEKFAPNLQEEMQQALCRKFFELE